MATLEQAAEALVVKLKGLDGEIAASETKIEAMREEVEKGVGDVAAAFEATRTAADAFLAKVAQGHAALDDQAEHAVEAASDAKSALTADAEASRHELEERTDALAETARILADTGSALEKTADEAALDPARTLASRARALEQELAELVREAVAFVRDEVVTTLDDSAEDLRDRSSATQERLAEETVQSLQAAYDAWERGLATLEDQLETQSAAIGQMPVRAAVEQALAMCGAASGARVESLKQVVAVLASQVQEMAAAASASADELVDRTGQDLLAELEATRLAAVSAALALDGVRGTLAAYSFVDA